LPGRGLERRKFSLVSIHGPLKRKALLLIEPFLSRDQLRKGVLFAIEMHRFMILNISGSGKQLLPLFSQKENG
jgi:hypothetical protein